MKIQYLSDLHLEFFRHHGRNWHIPDAGADLVVLAGDIDVGLHGIDWAISETERLQRPILYVFGNHEYYDSHLGLSEKAKEHAAGSQVTVLENDAVTIGGVRFIGTTLWTDFGLYGNAPLAGLDAQDSMTDYRKIRVPPSFRRLTFTDVQRKHQESRRFLESQAGAEEPVVVITHHAPSERSIPPAYRNSNVNPAYASRLDGLAAKFDFWIHGHIHHPVDYRIGRCRVVSNPLGYFPIDTCPGFRNDACFVI